MVNFKTDYCFDEDIKMMCFTVIFVIENLDSIKPSVAIYQPSIIARTETEVDKTFDDYELLDPSYTVINERL